MKNKNRFIIVLMILMSLFTLCYFAIPYSHKNEKVFVLTYIFTFIAFVLQGYILYISIFKSKTLKSKVYGLPILRIGVIYLVFSLIISFLITIINAFIYFPTWVSIIISLFILGFAIIGLITTEAYKEQVEKLENNQVVNTSFMDNLKSDIKTLRKSFNYEPLNIKFNNLLDLIIYSDPVSNDKNSLVEDEIDKCYIMLKDGYLNKKYQETEVQIDKLTTLVHERNIRTKLNK